MDLHLILKSALVLIFLVAFLRRTNRIWATGLVTVATAFLIDAFSASLGLDFLREQIGYFGYVVAGLLFAGALYWLLGLLLPALTSALITTGSPRFASGKRQVPVISWLRSSFDGDTAVDRQMLFDQLRHRIGPDDFRDLIFDLELNENEILGSEGNLLSSIMRLMELAEANGQMGTLADACERLLAPPDLSDRSRLAALDERSPRHQVRMTMLQSLDQSALRRLAGELEIDWDALPGAGSKPKLREMLLHAIRHGDFSSLLEQLQPLSAGQQ